MAQLVSNSVALTVEQIFYKKIIAGVSATPSQSDLVKNSLEQVKNLSDHFILVDHLS